MSKKALNPEEKYRKDKKREHYKKAEQERNKRRKELSKTLDVDKLKTRLETIEKEEAAGRMTIGMRKEKANISAQLRSVTKKSHSNNFANQRRIPINETRNGQQKEPELKEVPPTQPFQSIPPPPPINNDDNTVTVAPPPPHVPIYNPMARHSKPINAGTLNINSSLIPTSVKLQASVPEQPKEVNNPFASLLPETDQPKEESLPVSVPGPKLRFTLVPYSGMESSDSDEKEEEKDKDNDKENQHETQEDIELAKFMQEIANMSCVCNKNKNKNKKIHYYYIINILLTDL